jgi:polyisoprenoid-binding protein YceI
MISNVKGNFKNFSGSFEFDEKTNTLKSFNGNVEVKSINTDNAKRDGHLQSSEFFAADKYPKITFKLDKIAGDKAYGKLTMRGVTKDVTLDYENNGSVKDPWGNTRVGIALSGQVNRLDYGIKYNSILETGGVAVGKIVKLDIEVEGILAK